ncbi:GTP cyclohydrolase 1 type 2/Nif3 [Mycena rebaudengoi]|nr:GTP cyclohydrolase 1 type 2/Nif3 [Mycena rebaudengoi]
MSPSKSNSTAATKPVCNSMQRMSRLKRIKRAPPQNFPCTHPSFTPRNVLLAIDEALARSASLIVSSYPPVFSPLEVLALATPLQSTLLRCAAAGISVYSPHTALDSMYGGVNDWLAGCTGTAPGGARGAVWGAEIDGRAGGTGGDGAGVASCRRLRVGYAPTKPVRLVSRVALCAGPGGSILSGTLADLYVKVESSSPSQRAHTSSSVRSSHPTSPSLSSRLEALCLSIVSLTRFFVPSLHPIHSFSVLHTFPSSTHFCGHTNTERGFLPVLFDKLCAKLEPPPHLAPSEERDAEAGLHGRGAGKRAGHPPAGDRVAHSSA